MRFRHIRSLAVALVLAILDTAVLLLMLDTVLQQQTNGVPVWRIWESWLMLVVVPTALLVTALMELAARWPHRRNWIGCALFATMMQAYLLHGWHWQGLPVASYALGAAALGLALWRMRVLARVLASRH